MLVVRKQSPKALRILERKRLEPQALQGSLPNHSSAKEAQVGALGISWDKGREEEPGEADSWKEALKGLIWGAGEGNLSKLPVKGKSLPRGPLARPCTKTGQMGSEEWPCSPRGGRREGLASAPRGG